MSGRHWWSQTFANDGGPLIALPHELVGHWSGTQLDYDRACDAGSPVELFSVGPGLMVVMTSPDTMIYEANWLRLKGLPGITLVGWDTWSGDRRKWLLARLVRRGLGWRRHPRKMTIASGVLVLQHAAGQAADVRFAPAEECACIGQVVPAGIEPGRYAMSSVVIDETRGQVRYCCVLCRWEPA
jgi:hypothetical protein